MEKIIGIIYTSQYKTVHCCCVCTNWLTVRVIRPKCISLCYNVVATFIFYWNDAVKCGIADLRDHITSINANVSFYCLDLSVYSHWKSGEISILMENCNQNTNFVDFYCLTTNLFHPDLDHSIGWYKLWIEFDWPKVVKKYKIAQKSVVCTHRICDSQILPWSCR